MSETGRNLTRPTKLPSRVEGGKDRAKGEASSGWLEELVTDRTGGFRNRPKDPLDHEPDAVRYAREHAGLTKAELARRCGVSPSLITEIEGGTRNATPAMLNKLAHALNCPRVVLERKREYGCCQARESGCSHAR